MNIATHILEFEGKPKEMPSPEVSDTPEDTGTLSQYIKDRDGKRWFLPESPIFKDEVVQSAEQVTKMVEDTLDEVGKDINWKMSAFFTQRQIWEMNRLYKDFDQWMKQKLIKYNFDGTEYWFDTLKANKIGLKKGDTVVVVKSGNTRVVYTPNKTKGVTYGLNEEGEAYRNTLTSAR